MKTKKIYFLFIMFLLIGGVTFFEDNIAAEISRYCSYEMADIIKNIIYDGLYYIVLLTFGILTMKFASKNYDFDYLGYIIGAALFAASMFIMFNMTDGNRKDIFFAICSFIPSVQIMSFINDRILNYILSWKYVKKSGALEVIGVIILLISAVSVYIFHLHIYIMLYYAFLYFYGAYTKRGNIPNKIKLVFGVFGTLALIYVYGNKIVFTIKNMTIANMGYDTYIVVCLYVLWLTVLGFCENTEDSEFWKYLEKINVIHIKPRKLQIEQIEYYNIVKNHIYSTAAMFFLICGVEMFIRFMAMPEFTSDGILNVLNYFV